MNLNHITSKLLKSKLLFVICFILLNIITGIQLFQFDFLPLGDWIPHIYNSGIIHELLFHADSPMHEYYVMDYNAFTNLTDHILIAGFKCLTSGAVSSQLVVLLTFILIQVGFYLLITSLKLNRWWTFLVIPFFLNGTFIIGMINFNIGIGLMFILLSCWIRYFEKPSVLLLTQLIVFPLLIYVTHIFVYGIAALASGIFVFIYVITTFKNRMKSLKDLSLFIGSNLIPGIIFVNYFLTKTDTSKSISLGNISAEQIVDFINLKFLVGYNSVSEGLSLRILMITVGILLLFSLVSLLVPTLRKRKDGGDSCFNMPTFNISNLVVILVMVVALLVLPAKIKGAGSYIDLRIQIMLSMFCLIAIVILLGKAKYEKFLLVAIIPVLISVNLHKDFLFSYWETRGYPVSKYISNLSDDWDDYESAMVIKGDIPWYMLHYGNALGIENNVICYENYEAISGHFSIARVEGSVITKISKKVLYFRSTGVPWDMIIPDNEPDNIIYIQRDMDITVPEELYDRYDTISDERVGDFRIVEMRKEE